MHLSALLDVDLLAVEQTDELALLVELTAPTPTTATARQPATLIICLDRSGSMGGDRLEAAKTALLALVDRLAPTDSFGVVAFDDRVQIVVPAGPLTDKAAVKQAIARLEPGGSTDLSAGWFRALQEAQRVQGPTGATCLLISDGHANAGETDPSKLEGVAATYRQRGTTTSTLGLGLGYDQTLLGALSRGGGGNPLFAEEADTATAMIAGEVDGLLEQVAQAASLRLSWGPYVSGIDALNDLTVVGLPDGALLELGSFYAGETRRLLITLKIPGIAALGLVQVATLEFTHVSLPDLVLHTTTLPVHVNVVPGDQAAGRIPDPKVRSELLFQQTQRVKRESSRLLDEGRAGEASALLFTTSARLRSDAAQLPPPMAMDLYGEADLMDALADESSVDLSRAAKVMSTDAALKGRYRGRQTRGGRIVLRCADGSCELVLEEWELLRLVRGLPGELARLLRPSTNRRSEASAQLLADALDAALPAHGFFAAAAGRGGFAVGRA